ncbi:hypothetical protein T12_13099 [Trichinella patagoniensis]|uniref:Uncharacterized protein n=1 Tax=Trichinella patagoniensis TaxID=990121 RepID=A0A0V1A8X1_9BILA|nr:hypothetical protein T12_13099 [Trichinella patagoniensis]
MQTLLLAMIQMLPPGESVEYWLNFIVILRLSIVLQSHSPIIINSIPFDPSCEVELDVDLQWKKGNCRFLLASSPSMAWRTFSVKASISFLSSTLPSSLISTLYSFLYINKSGICIDLFGLFVILLNFQYPSHSLCASLFFCPTFKVEVEL